MPRDENQGYQFMNCTKVMSLLDTEELITMQKMITRTITYALYNYTDGPGLKMVQPRIFQLFGGVKCYIISRRWTWNLEFLFFSEIAICAMISAHDARQRAAAPS